MKDREATQETSAAMQSQVREAEDKVENQEQ